MKNVIDLISTELIRLQRNFELAEGVNWNVHPTKVEMTIDMVNLHEAIKILSNEREGLGKHEQKNNICPRCGSELRQNNVDGHIQCDRCKLGY